MANDRDIQRDEMRQQTEPRSDRRDASSDARYEGDRPARSERERSSRSGGDQTRSARSGSDDRRRRNEGRASEGRSSSRSRNSADDAQRRSRSSRSQSAADSTRPKRSRSQSSDRNRSQSSDRSRSRGQSGERRRPNDDQSTQRNRSRSSSSSDARKRSSSSSRKRSDKRPSDSNNSARRSSSSASHSSTSSATTGYRGLLERFGWKAIAVTVVIALVLVFLIVSGVRGCMGTSDQENASSSSTSASTSASASSASSSNLTPVEAIVEATPDIDQTTIDEDAIVNILGDDLASQLLTQAKSNNDAHWIAAHPDEFLEDGTIVRYKLLRLAAKEPQAISFVRNWPDQYCADKPDYSADHTNDSSNGVPRLYQWDERWGYTEYSSTTFALTGCAPTSLAMVYQARTGDTSKSPYDMGVFAVENGYATEYEGTDGSLFSIGGYDLGLSCTELNVDSYSLWQALADGMIVVVNVGPGDFTDGGHYLVATGLADDGTVIINDPFSAVRSNKTWDVDTIIDQTVALYAF